MKNILNKLTVGKKLNALTFMFLAFIFAVGGLGYYSTATVEKSLENVAEVQMKALQNMTLADMMHDGLRAVVYRTMVAADTHDAEGQKEAVQENKEFAENFQKYLNETDALPLAQNIKDAINNVRPDLENYIKSAEHIVNTAVNSGYEAAQPELPAFNKSFSALEESMGALGELIETQALKSVDEAKSEGKSLDWLVGGLVLICSLLGFGIASKIASSITKPVKESLLVMEKLAEGDFNQKVMVHSSDEIGLMGNAINKTIEALHTKVEAIRNVVKIAANGDLTDNVAITGEDPMGQIADSVNALLQNFRISLSNVGQNVATLGITSQGLLSENDRMTNSFSEASVQSNSVATAAEQIDGNIQVIASSMEEMGATVKEIAKNTSEAAKLTGSAVTTLQNADTTITQLGQASSEIGEVVKVITSIAEQTNLLALNATIEAARAGEAGKGFAVVANEVKELAKQTANATEEIGQKISMIKSSSEAAVSSVQEIRAVIGKVNDITSIIASAVEEQTVTTNEISRNMSGAASGSTEIVKNIKGIAETNNMATTGAVNGKRTAGELNEISQYLKGLLAKFRVDKDTSNTNRIVWTRGLATNDAEIDRQHKELFDRIDGLYQALNNGASTQETEKAFDHVESYCVEHLGYEQRQMESEGYPDYPAHKAQHDIFMKKWAELRQEFKAQGANLTFTIRVRRHVVDWFINHIKTVDVKLGTWLAERGIKEHHA
ncbi:bacteriohemerythrin [bacterium]|nr:bacteriohemerythrin [bacterium]